MKPVAAVVAGTLALIAIAGAAYLIDPVMQGRNRLPDVSIGLQQGPIPASDPPAMSITGGATRGDVLFGGAE